MIRTAWWLIVTLAGLAASPVAASIDTRGAVEVEPGSGEMRAAGRVRWVNETPAPVSALCLLFDGETYDGLTVTREDGPGLPVEPRGAGVARIPLTPAVEPGTSVVLDLDWRSEAAVSPVAPDAGPAVTSGRWVRMAVPEAGGCHDRLVAERGRFRLRVDLPRGWRVVATGSDVGRDGPTDGDDRRTRSVWSVDAVDHVAWVAVQEAGSVVLEGDFDPLSVPSEWVAEAAAVLGRPAVELQLPPVQLRVVAAADLETAGHRLLDELRLALTWFGLYHGGYPWPQLDVVLLESDVPDAFPRSATLAMVSEPRRSVLRDPTGVRSLRRLAASVVAAETIRSVVTFDASTPAALVAGLERHAVESYLTWSEAGTTSAGDGGSRSWARCRLRFAASGAKRDAMADERAELAVALLLRSLERRFGRPAVADGLRTWADAARLGTTSYGDLRAALLSATAAEATTVLDAVVVDNQVPDWSVRQVTRTVESVGSDVVTTVVDLHRTVTGPVPVGVRLRFADGREEWRVWEGDDPTIRWILTTDAPVTEVAVDPDVEWVVEVRRADNVWRASQPWWRRLGPSWLAPGVLLLRMVMWPWS